MGKPTYTSGIKPKDVIKWEKVVNKQYDKILELMEQLLQYEGTYEWKI